MTSVQYKLVKLFSFSCCQHIKVGNDEIFFSRTVVSGFREESSLLSIVVLEQVVIVKIKRVEH